VDYKEKKIKLSPEEALFKIKSWCAYQERSQHETRQKIYEYGLHSEEVESIISELISENFVNEERFAMALTGGKFRIKHWGKNKIRIELKKHRISEHSINKAILSIEDKDYIKTLETQIEKKLKLLKGSTERTKFHRTYAYLVSRGFESDLVSEKLNKLRKNKEDEFRSEE